ncbi:glycosyltransferase involved in cell wall biosynthesis [Streptosporangium album]|uniref:Glycosyltransferase involved in cell wall biosynthesis n=1 Tax=Streptosporangium album TaxID=47479 RepID=A0A7W7WBG2_9ACTN|nr:glycosyltransferase family 2 protein [Streptosporangium album]MBB4940184.1 glycosyltransferase involved in cell wall biosynthesis [Streptosporangium album]
MTARITGNDYRSLTPPELGAWTPSLRVSVVVPAYGGQDKLDLVLAGLAGQSYPAGLTEVIVVDNGSEPPLRLPEIRPEGTRLITCPTPGRAHARNAGLRAATGDVIHWLDSDVVLDRRSVEAHMRWHHAAPYLVVTGYLRFTPAGLPTPETVAATDDLAGLFEPAEPHAWLVDLIERTGGLTDNPHRAFSLHVGGATSVNAALFTQAGPMDTELILGQDTEMGYRLAQAGAVFVPEPLARAFHLGPTMRMRDKAPIDRVSHAFVADRIPSYRWLRSHPARQWKVPYLEVVVEPAGRQGPAEADGRKYGYDEVRATVDAVLAGTLPDVVVTVPGPWDRVRAEGRAPLTDPDLDLVLIQGHYAHEGRVRFVSGPSGEAPALPPHPPEAGAAPRGGDPPETGVAAPYRLRLPAGWVPGEDSLARLLDLARDGGYGLVAVLLAEDSSEAVVAARLERTAAFARAAIVVREGEDLDDAVEDTFGMLWVDGQTYGFLPEARQLTGRRGAYRARTEAQAEIARLTKETERLRAQVTRWRDEAGRWRKSAVEMRREIGGLRKELAAARKIVQYGLLSSVKRAIIRRR